MTCPTHAARFIAAIVTTMFLVGCVSFDYTMDEYNAPVYSELDPAVLNRLTDE